MDQYHPVKKQSQTKARRQTAASTAANMMTVTEVAALIGVGEMTVRKACDAGRIPCIRIQTRYLIPRDKFNEWYLRQVNVSSTPEAQKNIVRDIVTAARIEQLLVQLTAINDELRRMGVAAPSTATAQEEVA